MKITDAGLPADRSLRKQVEIVEVTPGLRMIIVGPQSSVIQNSNTLNLIKVAPMALSPDLFRPGHLMDWAVVSPLPNVLGRP